MAVAHNVMAQLAHYVRIIIVTACGVRPSVRVRARARVRVRVRVR